MVTYLLELDVTEPVTEVLPDLETGRIEFTDGNSNGGSLGLRPAGKAKNLYTQALVSGENEMLRSMTSWAQNSMCTRHRSKRFILSGERDSEESNKATSFSKIGKEMQRNDGS